MTNLVAPLPGNKFYALIGDGASPEVFTFFCAAVSIDSTHSVETEEAYTPDCDDPTKLPVKYVAVKGKTWDLKLSGLCDPSKAGYARIKTLLASDDPRINMKLMKNVPGSSNGYVEASTFVLTNWQESKADNGLVKFTLDLRGSGASSFTANS